MKKKKTTPRISTSSNPAMDAEWSAEDFRRSRPASEVFPDIVAAYRRTRSTTPDKNKVPVSIRLSPDVLAHFRAMGAGWQTRLDNALKLLISVK